MNNKMFKATIATSLIAASASVVAPAMTEASSFSDVDATHAFYKEITSLAERGMINGFEDGSFRANEHVTRGQAAKMIANLLNLNTETTKNPAFTDVKESNIYYNAIAALANAGIINGYEDNTFRPNETVTRNHMAIMLTKAFKLASSDVTLPFTDVAQTYAPYVAALYAHDITKGKTATLFDGQGNVTRGQLAAFIVRAENVVAQSSAKTVTITNITDDAIETDAGTFTASDAVKALFTAQNAQALVNAEMTVEVKDHAIQAISSLALHAVNADENVLVLDGGNVAIDHISLHTPNMTVKNVQANDIVIEEILTKPVASLNGFAAAPIASTVTFEGVTANTVFVKRNETTVVSDTAIPTVEVAASVSAVQLQATIDKLNVLAALSLSGNAKVKQLVMAEAATITLDNNVAIDKIVLPKDTKAETAITNLKDVATNIQAIEVDGKAVDFAPAPAVSAGPSITQEAPKAEQTINGVTYFNIAGTYGGENAETPRIIEGDVVINSADITLENVVIKGNLTLAASIGDGDAHLQNVKVEGQTFVNGGGKNSVYFTDTVLATVIVNKNTGAVRIVAQGATQVYEVQLETPTRIEEINLDENSPGFEDIVVTEALQTTSDGMQVELVGEFETINSRATNVLINLSEETNIQTLVLQAAAAVTGLGNIDVARINAEGSTISQQPQNVVLDIDGTVTIGEGEAAQTIAESYSNPEATAEIQSISATQGIINVNMTAFIAGLTADDFEVVATMNDEVITLDNLAFNAEKQRFTFDPIVSSTGEVATVNITVTPKHDKLNGEATSDEFTVGTGFGGRITDISGNGIPNLTIKFRAGSGVKEGEVVAEAKTDAYGYYTVNVPAGVYTGEFSAPGYLTTYIVATAASDKFLMDQNETAMRAAASQEVKIMLTWNEQPYDLDSHLNGPVVNSDEGFHVFYGARTSEKDGFTFVDLDWDDTDSYGPETTTIRKLVDGTYRFYVHNFSKDATLVGSGAKVQVFLGNAQTASATFEVSGDDEEAIYWDVFDLVVTNNGQDVNIVTVNKLREIPLLEKTYMQMLNELNGNYFDIELSSNASLQEKTAAIQAIIDTVTLPENITATVTVSQMYFDEQGNAHYDEEAPEGSNVYYEFFVRLTDSTDGGTYNFNIHANFSLKATRQAIDAIQQYGTFYVEVPPTATDEEIYALLQAQLSEIELPEGYTATLEVEEEQYEDGTYKTFYVVVESENDRARMYLNYAIFITGDDNEPTEEGLILEQTFNEFMEAFENRNVNVNISNRASRTEKAAALQEKVDTITLPEDVTATVYTTYEDEDGIKHRDVDAPAGQQAYYRYHVELTHQATGATYGFNLNPTFSLEDTLKAMDAVAQHGTFEVQVSPGTTEHEIQALLQQQLSAIEVPEGYSVSLMTEEREQDGIVYKAYYAVIEGPDESIRLSIGVRISVVGENNEQNASASILEQTFNQFMDVFKDRYVNVDLSSRASRTEKAVALQEKVDTIPLPENVTATVYTTYEDENGTKHRDVDAPVGERASYRYHVELTDETTGATYGFNLLPNFLLKETHELMDTIRQHAAFNIQVSQDATDEEIGTVLQQQLSTIEVPDGYTVSWSFGINNEGQKVYFAIIQIEEEIVRVEIDVNISYVADEAQNDEASDSTEDADAQDEASDSTEDADAQDEASDSTEDADAQDEASDSTEDTDAQDNSSESTEGADAQEDVAEIMFTFAEAIPAFEQAAIITIDGAETVATLVEGDEDGQFKIQFDENIEFTANSEIDFVVTNEGNEVHYQLQYVEGKWIATEVVALAEIE